jgi:O-antigen/teichoic acid export membrane protein
VRVKEKAIEGLSYGVTLKIITVVLQTVTNLAVAHYLSSTEYGVVAFALVYINFLTQFGDIGLTSAAVQREHLSDDSLHTAFTIKLVLGLLLGLIGAGIAWALAAGGGRPVGGVLAVLSANFLISSLGFLPQTRLTRSLDYRGLAIVQMVATLASTVITVVLVMNRFSYWGVALGYTGASLASVLAFNLMAPTLPKLRLDVKTGMSFMMFGGVIFSTGLLNFIIMNSDNFLVGWLAGQAALGNYALAFNWSFVATWQILGVLVSVLFPLYSKIQSDRAQVKALYLKSLQYTSMLVVLLNVGLFCLAPQFLYLVLGGGSEKWFPALATLRILCVDGLLLGLIAPIFPMAVAIGKPGIALRAIALAAVIEISLLVPALKLANIEGVAVAVTIACMSQYIVYVPALKKELGIVWRDLAMAVGPSMVGGCLMLAIWAITLFHGAAENSWVALAGGSLLLGTCFMVVCGMLTRWGLYREIAAAVRERRMRPL